MLSRISTKNVSALLRVHPSQRYSSTVDKGVIQCGPDKLERFCDLARGQILVKTAQASYQPIERHCGCFLRPKCHLKLIGSFGKQFFYPERSIKYSLYCPRIRSSAQQIIVHPCIAHGIHDKWIEYGLPRKLLNVSLRWPS